MNTSTRTRLTPVFRSLGESPAAPREAPATLRDHLTQRCDIASLEQTIARITMPFWFDHAFDRTRRGYVLGYDAVTGLRPDAHQLLVSQARLLWTFSRAHVRGYSDASRDYLRAAMHGYESLLATFKDDQFGGYYWAIDSHGLVDPRKVLYAESFLIFALVEYSRAAKSDQAMAEAVSLFEWIDADRVRRGQDRPLDLTGRNPGDAADIPVDVAGVAMKGYRCANTVLHWMEALTELYIDTQLPSVGRALSDSVQDNRTIFYPSDLRNAVAFKQIDPALRSYFGRQPTSYGHNVEFGWLMIHAQQALGVEPDHAQHQAMVDHTLQFGFDHERGGVFNSGPAASVATDHGKTWWTQAEMIVALSYLFESGRAQERHLTAMMRLLSWFFDIQMDPATGSPLWEMREDGTPSDTRISCSWQAAYHDLRARWILIDLLNHRLRP